MDSIIYDDGAFEYKHITKDTLEGGLDVMRKSFFVDESVAIAVELRNNPKAIKELEELCVRAAKDGVSIVAADKTTGEAVGIAFNKMQIKGNPGDDHYFEKFAATCKEPNSKSLVRFMKDCDETFDLFEHCNVDCLLEIMFLATLSEHRGKGVARKLSELTIDLARNLRTGKTVKRAIDDEVLPSEPTPKAVSAIFTSHVSQKIGKSLGFEKAIEIDYNRWSFNGKTYGERIGPLTPFTTLEYKML